MLSLLNTLTVILSLRSSTGSLSLDNFSPDVECGAPFAMFNEDGSRTDMMCAIITEGKPNYLVLNKEKSDDGHQKYYSDFCALRSRSDGSLGSDKKVCDPDGSKRFTFTRQRSSTSSLLAGDTEVTLSTPIDFIPSKAEVFTSSDPNTGEVGMLFPDGPWYFKLDNQFVEIPTVCPRKLSLKNKLFSRKKQLQAAVSYCVPMQGRWTSLSLGGLDYHLYFGRVVERFAVEKPFVLVVKRPEEFKLQFYILLPVEQHRFKAVIRPFKEYDEEWRTLKKSNKKKAKRIGRDKIETENIPSRRRFGGLRKFGFGKNAFRQPRESGV